MDYIVNPIAFILKWTFDYILVPLGELPDIINPNSFIVLIIVIGVLVWLRIQRKLDRKAERESTLK